MKRTEQKLNDLLKQEELTIALAESMTCGLAAATLGNTTDTSEVFAGGIVCYEESVKRELLQVSSRLIRKYTAESQEVTDALARKLRRLIKADLCAAITGLAAPGGTETKRKPVGTVFFSVLMGRKIYRLRRKFNGSPLTIKKKACEQLFQLALRVIRKHQRKPRG